MSDETKPAMRVSYDINVASIAQALVFAGVGAFLFVTNAASKVEATTQQLNSFRTEIVSRLQDFQTDNKSRFEEISRVIASLPDQTAALRQLEYRVARLEAFKTERDKQVSDLSALAVQMHADLSTILSANHSKLGTRGQ